MMMMMMMMVMVLMMMVMVMVMKMMGRVMVMVMMMMMIMMIIIMKTHVYVATTTFNCFFRPSRLVGLTTAPSDNLFKPRLPTSHCRTKLFNKNYAKPGPHQSPCV
jgi:hypothetical protein